MGNIEESGKSKSSTCIASARVINDAFSPKDTPTLGLPPEREERAWPERSTPSGAPGGQTGVRGKEKAKPQANA